eukprot:s1279_g14.t1
MEEVEVEESESSSSMTSPQRVPAQPKKMPEALTRQEGNPAASATPEPGPAEADAGLAPQHPLMQGRLSRPLRIRTRHQACEAGESEGRAYAGKHTTGSRACKHRNGGYACKHRDGGHANHGTGGHAANPGDGAHAANHGDGGHPGNDRDGCHAGKTTEMEEQDLAEEKPNTPAEDSSHPSAFATEAADSTDAAASTNNMDVTEAKQEMEPEKTQVVKEETIASSSSARPGLAPAVMPQVDLSPEELEEMEVIPGPWSLEAPKEEEPPSPTSPVEPPVPEASPEPMDTAVDRSNDPDGLPPNST